MTRPAAECRAGCHRCGRAGRTLRDTRACETCSHLPSLSL